MSQAPSTIGELRRAEYRVLPVRTELRRNLIRKLSSNEELFSGIRGYDDSVIPQIENAILAGQDMVLLGERGQAKSRLIRSLVSLLDDAVPAIAGCEINDDPYAPICRRCRDLVAEHGDATELAWLTPEQRYSEKLATPDTSIADLIGEVDPIRVAEGRYLSDELTIHYGLIPRTNRGIFAINELPDLAERIQVGLLNIIEERDVQIRGYRLRLPLDVFLLAAFGVKNADPKLPVIGIVSRFAAQKGFDLIAQIMDRLAREEMIMVVLGSGDKQYEEMFARLNKQFPHKIALKVAYDNAIAHKIEAGSDMFLMPSKYEPCGLNQIYSLKYGTVPIVRATGGLDDTIEPWDARSGKGTGFKFTEYNGESLLLTIKQAVQAFRDQTSWQVLMRNGMNKDFSWNASAREYGKIYERVKLARGAAQTMPEKVLV